MDVLHVIHQFAPETRGGSESYVAEVARRQRARGLDVGVLTGSLRAREAVTVVEEEVFGLPVWRLHRDDLFFDHHAKMWHPEVERAFLALCERLRPRLVHVHHWIRLTCNLVELAARQGIPAVATLHDYWTSCPRAFRQRRDDAACRRPLSVASCGDCVPRYGHEPPAEIAAGIELFRDHFRAELSLARAALVAVGSTADLLSASTGVPRDRFEVLPLGYERRFPGEPPLPGPRPGEPFRFAYWGSVGRHKGVDVLLAAFRAVHARAAGPSGPGATGVVELHVLGDFATPEFERELRAAAAGLPVTFHGSFTPERLRAVAPHAGVFPSTCLETYGIVLDECFELGLPCVVSDLGALAERAAGAGLKVPAGDVHALAAALDRVRNDAAFRERLCAAIPPPPPTLDAHVAALSAVYERARTAPPREPFAEPVAERRRVHFLLQQRESALGRIVPADGPK